VSTILCTLIVNSVVLAPAYDTTWPNKRMARAAATTGICLAMSPTARRRSTVHDFSTLRLHPDGARVSITSPTRTGLYRSRTRNTGFDTRGNRVARDAAGIGTIPKRTVICEDDNGEEIPVGPGVSDDEVQSGSKPRVPRRRKRRRLDTDVEFLGDPGTDTRRAGVDGGGANANTNAEAMSWPVPSSVREPVVFFSTRECFLNRFIFISFPFYPRGSWPRYTGPAEMRTSFYEPLLRRARTAVRSIASIKT
jgi:hypothetical protein